MICVVFLALVAFTNAIPLTPMDQPSLALFTKMFRKTLLDKVALEWNTTITMTNTLKTKMTTCNGTINAQIQSCKACTNTTCHQTPSSSDPSFLDYIALAYLALANPYTYLEGPLNDLTSKFVDVANLMGDEAGSFFSGIKDVVGSATQLPSGITDTFNGALSGLNGALSGLNGALGGLNGALSGLNGALSGALSGLNGALSGISSLGGHLTDTLTDAGKDIGHALGNAVHSVTHLFGRRELEPKVVECMKKCAPCHPLLLPTDVIVSQVCGADIVNMNNTISASVKKIKGVYDACLDTTHPIIAKMEYDMTSANPQMQLTRVYLTVRLNGHEVRYQTSVPYAMMQIPQTAHDMALEYWNKFQ